MSLLITYYGSTLHKSTSIQTPFDCRPTSSTAVGGTPRIGKLAHIHNDNLIGHRLC